MRFRAARLASIKELIRRSDQAIGAFATGSRTTYTRVFELEKSAS
jgi:hypothetical protein